MKQDEYVLQCQIVAYCSIKHIECYAIPMGEARASYCPTDNGKRVYDRMGASITGARIKRMGGKKGIADLLLIHGGKVIFVEVKTPTGRLTPEQREFQKVCQINGQPYFIARSLEGFMKELETVVGEPSQINNGNLCETLKRAQG
jgi:hypothetical protein